MFHWSIDWLIDWFIECSIDPSIDWTIYWSIVWLIDCSIDWLIGCLFDWLIDQWIAVGKVFLVFFLVRDKSMKLKFFRQGEWRNWTCRLLLTWCPSCPMGSWTSCWSAKKRDRPISWRWIDSKPFSSPRLTPRIFPRYEQLETFGEIVFDTLHFYHWIYRFFQPVSARPRCGVVCVWPRCGVVSARPRCCVVSARPRCGVVSVWLATVCL